MAETVPLVSIVIRTFNEERHLPELLDMIECQSCRDHETIVVDSGSFDRTVEIAEERVDQVIRIRPDDFTFGYSLNAGIRASSAPVCVIVSAHAIPLDERWLSELVAPFDADEHVAATYGRQVGASDSKFSEQQDFARTFPAAPMQLDPSRFFVNNANAAIRRDLWEHHPFDEALPGLEDLAWAKHWFDRGREIRYAPAACITHIHDETWPRVRHRYHREGLAARWIGVTGRCSIPGIVAGEGRNFVSDVYRLGRERSFGKVPEVCRFRFEKALGVASGTWKSANLANPLERKRLLYERQQRAVVIRGPGEAKLEEIEVRATRPGEVLVRVAYNGVCRTDLEILHGKLGHYREGRAHYPVVPGHELSGRIAEVGARADSLEVGEPVVIECIQGCGACDACAADNAVACLNRQELGVLNLDGGYAEYVVAPARAVHRVPEGLDLLTATLCEPTAVVVKALRRVAEVAPKSGSLKYAVVGGGPIGHLSARILQLRGHDVTLIDRRADRRALLAATGIDTDDSLDNLRAADVVVEATGDPTVLGAMLDAAGIGTRILLVGLPYARQPFNFETTVNLDHVIVGSLGSSGADFDEALRLLPQLDLDPFFANVVSLEDFERAWADVAAGAHLKTIVAVHGDDDGGRALTASAGRALER